MIITEAVVMASEGEGRRGVLFVGVERRGDRLLLLRFRFVFGLCIFIEAGGIILGQQLELEIKLSVERVCWTRLRTRCRASCHDWSYF